MGVGNDAVRSLGTKGLGFIIAVGVLRLREDGREGSDGMARHLGVIRSS